MQVSLLLHSLFFFFVLGEPINCELLQQRQVAMKRSQMSDILGLLKADIPR